MSEGKGFEVFFVKGLQDGFCIVRDFKYDTYNLCYQDDLILSDDGKSLLLPIQSDRYTFNDHTALSFKLLSMGFDYYV